MKQYKTPIWMSIYADLIVNLMFFFLAAWVLSRVDEATRMRVTEAFKDAITGRASAAAVTDAAEPLQAYALNENSQVEISEDRVKIIMRGDVLFASGSLALGPAARQNLHDVAALLAKTGRQVMVEGFTDDVPLASGGTNWELSLRRAMAVADYFAEVEGMPQSRFSVAGYGEYHPRVPNTSEENRQMNRRIELHMVRYE